MPAESAVLVIDMANDFVYAGVSNFCSAIEVAATSSFYRSVARLTRVFIALEKDAFAFDGEE